MNQFVLFTTPGEYEIVAPYTRYTSNLRISRHTISFRFVHDPHNWNYKSTEQRTAIIAAYYAYQPPQSEATVEFNIPPRAGRKPGKSNIRGSTTTRESSSKRIQ